VHTIMPWPGYVMMYIFLIESASYGVWPKEHISTFISMCMVLSVKSGRLGLLLRTLTLILITENVFGDGTDALNSDRTESVPPSVIQAILKDLDVVSKAASVKMSPSSIPEVSGDNSTANSSDIEKESDLVTRDDLKKQDDKALSMLSKHIQKKRRNGGLMLSFGKAEHGKLGLGDTMVRQDINSDVIICVLSLFMVI
jgi:hypothetical protein